MKFFAFFISKFIFGPPTFIFMHWVGQAWVCMVPPIVKVVPLYILTQGILKPKQARGSVFSLLRVGAFRERGVCYLSDEHIQTSTVWDLMTSLPSSRWIWGIRLAIHSGRVIGCLHGGASIMEELHTPWCKTGKNRKIVTKTRRAISVMKK